MANYAFHRKNQSGFSFGELLLVIALLALLISIVIGLTIGDSSSDGEDSPPKSSISEADRKILEEVKDFLNDKSPSTSDSYIQELLAKGKTVVHIFDKFIDEEGYSDLTEDEKKMKDEDGGFFTSLSSGFMEHIIETIGKLGGSVDEPVEEPEEEENEEDEEDEEEPFDYDHPGYGDDDIKNLNKLKKKLTSLLKKWNKKKTGN